ncbi:MAG: ACT domain-containing protein [Alkalibacterium sp.]|nr:ACT domain-containing protein [Alkalibacterium sp.]
MGRTRLNQLFDALKESYEQLYVKIETTYCKVSVIGAGMRDMTGVASKIFKTLLASDIPFYQVTTSEISVSYVVDGKNGEKAISLLCSDIRFIRYLLQDTIEKKGRSHV